MSGHDLPSSLDVNWEGNPASSGPWIPGLQEQWPLASEIQSMWLHYPLSTLSRFIHCWCQSHLCLKGEALPVFAGRVKTPHAHTMQIRLPVMHIAAWQICCEVGRDLQQGQACQLLLHPPCMCQHGWDWRVTHSGPQDIIHNAPWRFKLCSAPMRPAAEHGWQENCWWPGCCLCFCWVLDHTLLHPTVKLSNIKFSFLPPNYYCSCNADMDQRITEDPNEHSRWLFII